MLCTTHVKHITPPNPIVKMCGWSCERFCHKMDVMIILQMGTLASEFKPGLRLEKRGTWLANARAWHWHSDSNSMTQGNQAKPQKTGYDDGYDGCLLGQQSLHLFGWHVSTSREPLVVEREFDIHNFRRCQTTLSTRTRWRLIYLHESSCIRLHASWWRSR